MVQHILDALKIKAQQNLKKIIFPESSDIRILEACSLLKKQNVCIPVLIGDENVINELSEKNDFNVSDLQIINPGTYDSSFLSKKLFELRKHKGLTLEEAKELLNNPVYLGTMLLYVGEVDGLVSGATHSTADTLRPALQIIKTKPNIKLASSFFLMSLENKDFFFADCGFVINPDAEELSEIAISTADSAKNFGFIPKVAMLSFSTHGSAKHELSDKVLNATELVKIKRPDLLVDGEIQLDAAIIPDVCEKKCRDSALKGEANVLIFPDLNSGNIGYKLVERLAKSKAIGPIVQGLNKPVNDLSRGCSVQDIVDVTIITCTEAINNN